MGRDAHHLAVVQSSLPEVGEWAIKKGITVEGKVAGQHPRRARPCAGRVVSRVIKTESPTQDNEPDRLSFLDDVSSDVAGTGETSTLTL